MNLRQLIVTALEEAQGMDDEGDCKGAVHRNRSKNLVECLSTVLQRASEGIGNVVALSKHNPDHRKRFGMNELLFDIAVFQFSSVDSGKSAQNLSFVTKGIWIVESEMAKNKREALYDFNKLVLGRAKNKLFVGPLVDDVDDYLRVLSAPAKHCGGELFLALLPHPSEWPVPARSSIKVWQWCSSDWKSII